MKDWQTFLYYKTRDRAFQVQMVVMVLFLGLIGATVLHFVRPADDAFHLALSSDEFKTSQLNWVEIVKRMLANDEGMSRLLEPFERAGNALEPEMRYELIGEIEHSNLEPENKQILSGLVLSLIRGCENGPDPAFFKLVEAGEGETTGVALRYANQAMGSFYAACHLYHKAAKYFELEGRFEAASEARAKALRYYVKADESKELIRLSRDPLFAQDFTTNQMLTVSVLKHEWTEVLKWIIRNEYEKISWFHVGLTLLAGAFWLILLLQLGQFRGFQTAQVALTVAAILLGVISTTATVFVVVWQEEILKMAPTGTLFGDAFFFIMGVGFREEVLKLLFFMPLVPFLLKRGNQLEMLIIAGFVGLGFAAEENLNYYLSNGGIAMLGRFLTANFFHVASTGLLGLAFCRIFIFKKNGINDFTFIFWMIILCHGVYDLLLSSAAVSDYSYFAMTAYVALCLFFFREAHHLRQHLRHLIPPLTIFLFGISVLSVLALGDLTYQLGLPHALKFLIPSTLQLAATCFVFVRELPES